jgi:hypothetical protein
MGSNNTVNDLLTLMNNALSTGFSWGAPPSTDFAEAANAILSAFDQCRVFHEFSNQINYPARNIAPGNEEGGLTIYPNPTSGNTTLSFIAGLNQPIRLEVYDVNGRQVAQLLDRVADHSGPYSLAIDCRPFENGVYFVRLYHGDEVTVKKLVVMGQ